MTQQNAQLQATIPQMQQQLAYMTQQLQWQANQQQAPYQQQQQQQWNGGGGGGTNGNRKQFPKKKNQCTVIATGETVNISKVKRYDNWKYCWTHGCDVNHSGAECNRQAVGHQVMATHTNPMGGNGRDSNQKISTEPGRTHVRQCAEVQQKQQRWR